VPLEQTNNNVAQDSPDADRLNSGISAIERKMVSLYQTIISLIGDSKPKTIQFISSRPNEGSSTIIREFAGVAAGKLGKSVLLIDANRPNVQGKAFGITPSLDFETTVTSNRPASDAINSIENSKLHLAFLSTNISVPPSIIDTPEFDGLLSELSQKFDLILIDSPPASDAAEGLTLSPKLSGTILVVEAGSTRWQVSDSVQKRVVKYGGKILGVILNKRRNYIPAAIYSRL